MNLNKSIVRFIVPIGATLNMDATALMQGVAAVTIAQMYNSALAWNDYLTIAFTGKNSATISGGREN